MKKQTRMSAYTQFTIRCVRDSRKQSEDDVITVNPRWNCISDDCQLQEFVVQFKSAPSWEDYKTEHVLNGSTLYSYIGNLIDLLAIDTQPFANIQFDFPGMPSILTTPANLPAVRSILMNTMSGVIYNWATIVSSKKKEKHTLNARAEPFVPEAYRTPQRPTTRSAAPPRVERRPARHIFFDEEDGHVTRYYN